MTTTDIVLVTMLGAGEFITFCSLFYRLTGFEDNLWVEVVIMTGLGLFIYLITR